MTGASFLEPKRMTVLGALALSVLVAVAYLPVRDAGFIWDDDLHVVDNPVLEAEDGLRRIWTDPRATPQYYPLVHTTFLIEHALWGEDPLGYHLVNVALHGLAALALFGLLLRLGVPGAWLGAWLGAAVWALHPVQVESVAWITERKNVLAALAGLSALLLWTRFRPLEDDRPRRRWPLYALLLPVYALALVSKSVTCVLPAVALLLVWWRRGRIPAADWRDMAPLLLMGAIQGSLTARLERLHVGARGPEFDLDLLERFAIAGRAVVFYLGKFLWPRPLSFSYARWDVSAFGLADLLLPFGVVLALVVLVLLRRRIGRGPAAVALGFCGASFPALGFLDVYPFRYSFVADHFQYHALAFPAVGAAALIAAIPRARPRFAIAALLVLVLSGSTWLRSAVFESEESLWLDTLEKNPGSLLAGNNLGLLRLRQGRPEEALALFRSARASGIDEAVLRTHAALALVDLGLPDEAARELERARVLDPEDVLVLRALGDLALSGGDPAEALAHYEAALELEPSFAPAEVGRATALFRMGRRGEALRAAERAVELAPEDPAALNAHGVVLAALGDDAAAVERFRSALERAPGLPDAVLNLAQALGRLGRHEAARTALESLVAQHPEIDAARLALATARERAGDLAGAAALHRRLVASARDDAVRVVALVLGVKGALRDGRLPAARELLELGPPWPERARAELLAARADVAYASGERESALRFYRDAIAAARAAGRESRALELARRLETIEGGE